jgi:hypothetical protein
MNKKLKLCSGFIVLILIAYPSHALTKTILIANNAVGEEAAMSGMEIQRIFLGKKKRWADGQIIKPATLKKGVVHEDFVKKYIHRTPTQFSTFWKRVIVTGTGIPPKSFSTEAEIVEYVSSTKGAVGYISASTPHGKCKQLKVD